jgi:TctA family transporter
MNNSMFGVTLMLIAGVVAYVLEARMIAIAPIILGIVLGPLVESNFTTSMMISDGSLLGFFSRPVAAVLGLATLVIWAFAIFGTIRRFMRGRDGSDEARPVAE